MLNIKQLLWILPFGAFSVGYLLTQHLATSSSVAIPSLIGQPVAKALELTSATQLNLQVIGHKEDAHLPIGTIMRQTPPAHQLVRQNTTVFIVTSISAQSAIMPSIIDTNAHTTTDLLKKHALSAELIKIPTHTKSGVCIAQVPQPGELIKQTSIKIYQTALEQKPFLMPDLRGITYENAQNYLAQTGLFIIEPTTQEQDIDAQEPVSRQIPLPGTIINRTNAPIFVQLQ